MTSAPPPGTDAAQRVLTDVFGFDTFRPSQLDVVERDRPFYEQSGGGVRCATVVRAFG